MRQRRVCLILCPEYGTVAAHIRNDSTSMSDESVFLNRLDESLYEIYIQVYIREQRDVSTVSYAEGLLGVHSACADGGHFSSSGQAISWFERLNSVTPRCNESALHNVQRILIKFDC